MDDVPCKNPDGLVHVPAGTRIRIAGDLYTVSLQEPLDRPIDLLVQPISMSGMMYRDTPIPEGVGVVIRFVEFDADCAVRDVELPSVPGRMQLSLMTSDGYSCHIVQGADDGFDDASEEVVSSRFGDSTEVEFSVPGADRWACIDRPRTKAEIEADQRWVAGIIRDFSNDLDTVVGYSEVSTARGDVPTLTLVLILGAVVCLSVMLCLFFLFGMIRFMLSPSRIRDSALVVNQRNWFGVAWWFVRRAVKFGTGTWRRLRGRSPEKGMGAAAKVPGIVEPGSGLAASVSAWRNRRIDSFSLMYEQDTLLVGATLDQWRRIRRSDIRDLIIERTFWWDPLVPMVAFYATRWFIGYQVYPPGIVAFFAAMLLMVACELRRVTIIHGVSGAVLRVRLPIERVAVFLDWLDGPDFLGESAEVGYVLVDRGAALRSLGQFDTSVHVGPLGNLHVLLVSLFGVVGMRRFVVHYYQEIILDIPDASGSCTPQQMADIVVEALNKHGLIDAKMFERLMGARPSAVERICACARVWNINLVCGPASSRGG